MIPNSVLTLKCLPSQLHWHVVNIWNSNSKIFFWRGPFMIIMMIMIIMFLGFENPWIEIPFDFLCFCLIFCVLFCFWFCVLFLKFAVTYNTTIANKNYVFINPYILLYMCFMQTIDSFFINILTNCIHQMLWFYTEIANGGPSKNRNKSLFVVSFFFARLYV